MKQYTGVTRNAFMPALAADGFSYRKPIRAQDEWSMQALMSRDISLTNRVLDENLCADVLSRPSIVDNLEQIEVYSQEIAEIAIDRAEEVYGKE